MHYDELLRDIGGFGKYQKTKYFLICLLAITNAFQALVSIFTIATPKHRCMLPASAAGNLTVNFTDTWDIQGHEHSELVSKYIPVTKEGVYNSCYVYDLPSEFGNTTAVKCNGWVYDTSERLDTIVTQMNLVCDDNLKATLATTIYMVGNLVGSLLCGVISDRYGRRFTLLIGVICQVINGFSLAFLPDLVSILVFRFLLGTTNMMLFLSAFVMGMELVGPDYRVVTGVVIEIFWGIGFMLLVGLAYFIRTETYLQLAITLPCVLYIPYYWLLPESPRWLMAKGKTLEAEKIIADIARVNGTNLPDTLIEEEEKREPEGLKRLFYAPTLLCRCLIVFFNWFVISIAYFGLSFNSGNMPGSLYINLLFSAFGELVGYSLCLLSFIIGRRYPHVVSMIIGGVACICSVIIYYSYKGDDNTKNWIFIVLSFLGKIGVTIGFAIIYLWSAELFPTLLRNTLLGICSVSARFGSVMAPIIADIGKVVPPHLSQMLPPLIFGVLTVSGGLLSIALPETNRKALPETIAEANVFPRNLGDDRSRSSDGEDQMEMESLYPVAN